MIKPRSPVSTRRLSSARTDQGQASIRALGNRPVIHTAREGGYRIGEA